MTRLSTHVLDQYHGKPAAGVRVTLLLEGNDVPIAEVFTNADGRVDEPLLENAPGGHYQLVFAIGEYYAAQGVACPFLDRVPVWCCLDEGQRYHVPLLVTPWAYSVYRGS